MRGFIVVALAVAAGGRRSQRGTGERRVPGQDGLIAFQRTLKNDQGGLEDRIVTVRENGRKLKAITPRCCRIDEDPAWSPNGRRIAFSAFPPGGRITTMNKKGKSREKVTRGKRYEGKKFEDSDPSWSPDGSEIVFFRQLGSGLTVGEGFDLFAVGADGSNPRPLVTTDLDELEPAWSPDGEWIAFLARGTGVPGVPDGIYRMRPDGSDRQLVRELDDMRDGLDWSPDGELLVFSTRSGAKPQIHTVRPDGSGLATLTSESKPAFDAVFSPSGERIVYSVKGVLRVMDADGSNASRLLRRSSGRGDFAPSWQAR
jgi:TolB protein